MVKYNKKILVIGIGFIGLIILGIIGFTYAFFIAGVVGNPAAIQTVVETADLRLVFADTEVITMNNVLPGASNSKTFTISNIGNNKINYDINIIDITNTFTDNDLIYSLTSTNGGATVTNTPLHTINGILVSGTIESGITQVYTMTILFKETGINQNTNQGAAFTGKLQINASGLISDEVVFTMEETVGSVAPNQTMKINLLGNYYGKVNCTSADTNIAECTPSQNEISILGKNIGTTNITVTENNKNLETTYTVSVFVPTVYNIILKDNTALSDSSIDFTQPSSETNGKGLYYIENNVTYGEDNTKIYYFRGAVDNNWVSFGGFLWRIVRTTSEGGVKLAYSGDGSTTSSAFISNSAFNTSKDKKYYIGYTYNTSGYSGAQTDSTIKEVIDTWYTNNLGSYSSYLSDTAIYCNDRSSERIDGTTIYYPAFDRLISNKKPSYVCLSANQSRYTVSISTGNGYLQKPIAMLSADEIYYAGIRYSNPSSIDSYIMENTTGVSYWHTLSPFTWLVPSASEYIVSSLGKFSSISVDNILGVRPSISLKSCIIVSEGNGTKSIPYIISDSNC